MNYHLSIVHPNLTKKEWYHDKIPVVAGLLTWLLLAFSLSATASLKPVITSAEATIGTVRIGWNEVDGRRGFTKADITESTDEIKDSRNWFTFIQRSDDGGQSFITVGFSDGTSFSQTRPLAPGNTYHFRVVQKVNDTLLYSDMVPVHMQEGYSYTADEPGTVVAAGQDMQSDFILLYRYQSKSMQIPYIQQDNTVWVPYKQFLESLGATVTWSAYTNSGSATLNGTTASFSAEDPDSLFGASLLRSGKEPYIDVRSLSRFGFSVDTYRQCYEHNDNQRTDTATNAG